MCPPGTKTCTHDAGEVNLSRVLDCMREVREAGARIEAANQDRERAQQALKEAMGSMQRLSDIEFDAGCLLIDAAVAGRLIPRETV
jgi:hypothetical protein